MGGSDNALVARPTWVRWRIVALLLLFSAMSWFNRMSMQAAGDIKIIEDYQIDKSDFGFLITAFFLAYTICMTPGGWLTDVFGPRRLLTASVLGTALLTGLTALCGNPGLGAIFGVVPSFLVVRFLFGISASPDRAAPASCKAGRKFTGISNIHP